MSSSTEAGGRRIHVRGLSVEVVRKNIKNLYVGVYPPNGRVRVSAPLRLDDDAVRRAVVSRLGWIRRKQAEIEQRVLQPRREFVTGESHYFEGRCYRLDVIEGSGPAAVRLRGDATLALFVRPGADRSKRETVLNRWYRRQLRRRVPALLAEWEPKVGERIAEVRIRKMRTLWGSCNVNARRIWLNLELAKRPAHCLEYVLVHEMVHLIERRHNQRFWNLMDEFLSQWRSHKQELDRAPPPFENR